MTDIIRDIWWGYAEEHGWIMLDRTIKQNGTGALKGLLFLRCSDLKLIEVDWEKWCPPPYFYAPNYIESLDSNPSKQAAVKAEFNLIKAQESKFCDEIHRQYKILAEAESRRKRQELEKKHRAFLESLNINYSGVSFVTEGKHPRVTHCWNCKNPLDNSIDLECKSCGWILCSCGACGCGYKQNGLN